MSAGAELARGARSARALGILGGSFDPPHAGHLFVARTACEACGLDHVLFVPAARPPHKPGRRLAPAEDREAMLALLLADEPAFSVWTGELERAGPSYTIDTVRTLRGMLRPDASLFLLIGSDNLADLPRWHRARELLSLVTTVVVHRRGTEPDARALPADLRGRVRLLAVEPLDVSASGLRERLARGEDVGDALPPRVAEYVRERGIYAPA